METMFVSVVMPVYNGEMFLKESVESVLSQTYKDFEFIIIDDGSTDNTSSILELYRKKDTRIKIITQKNNGLPAALNVGIQHASSNIIFRMDADDIMLPERLHKQLAFFLSHPEATVVSCNAHNINSKGEIIGKTQQQPYLNSVDACKKYVAEGGIIWCLHPGVVFYRDRVLEVGGYDTRWIVGEDVDLWNRLADKGFYTIAMHDKLLFYRIHGNTITNESFSRHWHLNSCMRLNIIRRRRKEEEISPAEYENLRKRWNIITRLNDKRSQLGAFLERNAECQLGEKSILRGGLYLMGAIILRPRLALRKLRSSAC